MKYRTFAAFLILMAGLGSCAQRSTIMQGGNNSGDGGNSNILGCAINLAASVTTSGVTASVVVGTSVVFNVSASGCSGSYQVTQIEPSSAAQPITMSSTSPGLFIIPFNALQIGATAKFQVKSVATATAASQSVTVTSPSFDVVAMPTCSVATASNNVYLPMNAAGTVLSPVNTTFTVTANKSFYVEDVFLGSTNMNLSGLGNIPVLTQAVSVPVANSGSSTFTFKVRDIATDALVSCQKVVTGVRSVPCTVTTANTTMGISVNALGTVLSPATFSFTETANAAASLYAVEVNGVAATLNPALPTTSNLSNTVSVPISTVGASNLVFRVKDSANGVNSCNIDVTTTQNVVNTPAITAFSGSPATADFNSMVTLSLTATGNITSAKINNQAVTLNGSGVGTQMVTASTTGVITHTADVTGPGGATTQTANVTVKPTCSLTTSAASQQVGGDYPFTVVINGGYTSASLAGPGLSTVAIAASNTGINQAQNAEVVSGQGTGLATLTVSGPGGTTATCTANIKTLAATSCTLSSSASAATVGMSYPLNVVISGEFYSADLLGLGLVNTAIPGNPNGLTQSFNPLVVSASGQQVATLYVAAPNNKTVTCSTGINTLPQVSCALTASAAQVEVGALYPFRVTISGAFSSATLSGNGIATTAIAPSGTAIDKTVSAAVIAAAGTQSATLSVTTPAGTFGCASPMTTIFPKSNVNTCTGIWPTQAYQKASTPFDFTSCNARCGTITPPPASWGWTATATSTWAWGQIPAVYGYTGMNVTQVTLGSTPNNTVFNYVPNTFVGLSSFMGGTSRSDLWLQTNQRVVHVTGGELIKCAYNADGVNEPFIIVAGGNIRVGWIQGTPHGGNMQYSVTSQVYPLKNGEIPLTFNLSSNGGNIKWNRVFQYSN